MSGNRAELAESFANEFGARRWCSDWHDLLMDYEIDAIYVATPVHLHAQQTIAAAERGKHVLCEKPMALNVAEKKQKKKTCRSNDIKLGVAYGERVETHPNPTNIHQLLIEDFARAVLENRDPIVTGEIGRAVVEEKIKQAPDL